jgi:hypothetical protein
MSSCGVSYKAPKEDPQRTATLRGAQTRETPLGWKYAIYTVEAIDDTPVQLFFNDSKIVLTSGSHNIVISSFFNRGFGVGPYRARGDVTLNFMPGGEYKVNGRVEGSKKLLWIEDMKTGKAVSEVLRLSYQDAAQSTYVPIYLPAN